MSFFDFVTRAAIVLGAMVYPGYRSFKAVKRSDIPAQQRILKYWLVLSVMSALLLFLEPLLKTRVPFFNLFKLGVVSFLVLPQTKGYERVYAAVLQPFLDKNEAIIDDYSDKLYKAGEQHARNLGPTMTKYVQQTKDTVHRSLQKNKST